MSSVTVCDPVMIKMDDKRDGPRESLSLLDVGKNGFPLKEELSGEMSQKQSVSITSGAVVSSDDKAQEEDGTTPVYEWQDDNAAWQEYSPESCEEIHDGFKKWAAEGSQLFVENTIDISVDGQIFVIEFVNMTQTNDITGRFRKFRNQADTTKPCKWGDACTNVDCHFLHPSGDKRRGLAEDARGKIPCRWGEYCTRANCPFVHPVMEKPKEVKQPCQYGDECWEPSCDKAHPHGESRNGLNLDKHCRYGDNCTRLDCKQRHPNGENRKGLRCKFGDMCRRPQCLRKHPSGKDRVGLNTRAQRNGIQRTHMQKQRSLTGPINYAGRNRSGSYGRDQRAPMLRRHTLANPLILGRDSLDKEDEPSVKVIRAREPSVKVIRRARAATDPLGRHAHHQRPHQHVPQVTQQPRSPPRGLPPVRNRFRSGSGQGRERTWSGDSQGSQNSRFSRFSRPSVRFNRANSYGSASGRDGRAGSIPGPRESAQTQLSGLEERQRFTPRSRGGSTADTMGPPAEETMPRRSSGYAPRRMALRQTV